MFNGLFGKKLYKNILPCDAKERLQKNKNAILIDVRSAEEYKEVHIPNSKSLPLDKLTANISKYAKTKDDELIIYCLSGGRASSACNQLSAMGYTNVSNLGGIQSWPYETIKGR